MAHAERPVRIKLQDSDRSKNIICLFPWELVEQKEMLNAILVLLKTKNNKTEVTNVKLVLFKYVMSFETLTKVDQVTEILRFGWV